LAQPPWLTNEVTRPRFSLNSTKRASRRSPQNLEFLFPMRLTFKKDEENRIQGTGKLWLYWWPTAQNLTSAVKVLTPHKNLRGM
jgi:hypothetical protein